MAEEQERAALVGTDGKPMSVWQIWLRRLCVVMIVWAIIELALGVALWIAGSLFQGIHVLGLDVSAVAPMLGMWALVGAAFNVVIGLLGIRASKSPCNISLFFWITLSNAVLTAWAMASNISSGIIDIASIVSGLFIIALAVCAWQVRGQTGYFDDHL